MSGGNEAVLEWRHGRATGVDVYGRVASNGPICVLLSPKRRVPEVRRKYINAISYVDEAGII